MKELTMKRDKQIQVTAKQGNKCGVEGGAAREHSAQE